MTPTNKRTIRSFVLRQGRLSSGQHAAITRLWPHYGIEFNPASALSWHELFGNEHEVICEIGFGMGDSLWQQAKANPQQNFLGIEVHQPGVGALLMAIEREQLTNVRVIRHDAVEVLHTMIADNSLARVQIFFPDPWPKKRHHKRRLIQPDFVELLRQKLAPNACLHLATDWQDYAEHMLEVLQQASGFSNQSPSLDYCQAPAYRPQTKFEQRGLRLGHGVWDLLFSKL